MNKYEENQKLNMLNTIIEQKLFAYLIEQAKPDSFLYTFFKREIDLVNINLFLRFKQASLDRETVENLFFTGGNIEASRFYNWYPDNLNELMIVLNVNDYHNYLVPILEQGVEVSEGEVLDYAGYAEKLTFLASSRFQPFGLAPIVNYIIRREYEIESLKTLFISKRTQLNKEKINKTLELNYV